MSILFKGIDDVELVDALQEVCVSWMSEIDAAICTSDRVVFFEIKKVSSCNLNQALLVLDSEFFRK